MGIILWVPGIILGVGSGYNIRGSRYNIRGNGYNIRGTSHRIRSARYNFKGTRYNIVGSRYNIGSSGYNIWGTGYNIGVTRNHDKARFNQHRGYVRNKVLNKATGFHFSSQGHQISDMQVTIVEKVFNKCDFFRKRRESYFIRKFNSKHQGINRIT